MTLFPAYEPPIHNHTNPYIHRFCGSHTEPLLPSHWYDDVIALGDFELDSPLNVRQLDPFWHTARPIAWGIASSLTLPMAVQKTSCDAQLIEHMSMRRRVLPRSLGEESPHIPTLREVTREDAENADSTSVYLPTNGFLTAWPVWCPPVVSEYAKVCHVRDLLDYTSLTIEMGYLDDESAAEMLNARLFIPGACDIGIYPKSWLMPVLTAFERIGREFLRRYGDRIRTYDHYQIRAIGFVTERLGSYVLLRTLLEKYGITDYLMNADEDTGATLINSVPRETFGHMTVITESGVGYTPALANFAAGNSPT